jgi:hypothetical protein
MTDDPDEIDGDDAPPPERIGYKQPPKSGQFKPGRSGNTRGRPRGSKGRRRIVERVLLERHTVTENGTATTRTAIELVFLTMRALSLEGDPKAFKAMDILAAQFGPQEPKVAPGYLIVPEPLTQEEWDAKHMPKQGPLVETKEDEDG